jgi:PKHD-type hydroxylase
MLSLCERTLRARLTTDHFVSPILGPVDSFFKTSLPSADFRCFSRFERLQTSNLVASYWRKGLQRYLCGDGTGNALTHSKDDRGRAHARPAFTQNPRRIMTPFLTLQDALSSADCDQIVQRVQAAQMKDAGLVGGTTAHTIRRAEVAWLDDVAGAEWVMDRMIGLVAAANRNGFGFDLTDFGESAQVARYGAEREGHFDWHSDIGAKKPGADTWASKRKLTVVVQLSDPQDYEGGTLQLRPDSNVTDAPRLRGLATVFPSFVLHRVTPVTAGTRWSLTLWAHGPAFR